MKGAAFLDIVFYRLANYQGVGKSLGCGSMYKFMADEGSYDSSGMLMSNLFLAKPANKSLMNFVSLLITMKLLIALALYLMEKIRKKSGCFS